MSGDVGVNQGGLRAHDAIDGPDLDVAGDVVSVGGRSRCAQLFFSSSVAHDAPACGPGTQFQEPLIDDLAAACGFPEEVPHCSRGAAVDVTAGTELRLPPGVYGDVNVGGAASRHGRLLLTGGSYTFCSLRTRRGSAIEADSAAQVFVAGDVSIGPKSRLGPSAGLVASDLVLFSSGARFAVSRNADVAGRLCAPGATLQVTSGATLTGVFAADRIVAGRITLTGLSSVPTTTTSSTTSTTSTTSTQSSTHHVDRAIEHDEQYDVEQHHPPPAPRPRRSTHHADDPPTTSTAPSTTSTTLPPSTTTHHDLDDEHVNHDQHDDDVDDTRPRRRCRPPRRPPRRRPPPRPRRRSPRVRQAARST